MIYTARNLLSKEEQTALLDLTPGLSLDQRVALANWIEERMVQAIQRRGAYSALGRDAVAHGMSLSERLHAFTTDAALQQAVAALEARLASTEQQRDEITREFSHALHARDALQGEVNAAREQLARAKERILEHLRKEEDLLARLNVVTAGVVNLRMEYDTLQRRATEGGIKVSPRPRPPPILGALERHRLWNLVHDFAAMAGPVPYTDDGPTSQSRRIEFNNIVQVVQGFMARRAPDPTVEPAEWLKAKARETLAGGPPVEPNPMGLCPSVCGESRCDLSAGHPDSTAHSGRRPSGSRFQWVDLTVNPPTEVETLRAALAVTDRILKEVVSEINDGELSDTLCEAASEKGWAT